MLIQQAGGITAGFNQSLAFGTDSIAGEVVEIYIGGIFGISFEINGITVDIQQDGVESFRRKAEAYEGFFIV